MPPERDAVRLAAPMLEEHIATAVMQKAAQGCGPDPCFSIVQAEFFEIHTVKDLVDAFGETGQAILRDEFTELGYPFFKEEGTKPIPSHFIKGEKARCVINTQLFLLHLLQDQCFGVLGMRRWWRGLVPTITGWAMLSLRYAFLDQVAQVLVQLCTYRSRPRTWIIQINDSIGHARSITRHSSTDSLGRTFVRQLKGLRPWPVKAKPSGNPSTV